MTDPQLKIRAWLQTELKEAGHGAKGRLAEYLGVRPDAITRMANTAPGKETRVIQAHEHQKMIEFFSHLRKRRSSQQGLREVIVAAHVQAGEWAETWEWPDDIQYPVSVPEDDDLKFVRLHAAETKGPSMNRRWPEGTVVVFNHVAETQEAPQPGKRYIVERRRGGEAEHTVKLLTQDPDGRYWLMPESDDPRFQAPISVDEGVDGEEIAIIGRVRYAVTRE